MMFIDFDKTMQLSERLFNEYHMICYVDFDLLMWFMNPRLLPDHFG